jgi:hypothetical protein
MKARRRILITVLSLYAAGIVWGYFRLPWAAVRSLADYRLIAEAPAVSLSELDVSPAQLWYLRRALPVSPAPVVPRVSVSVTWYALVVARVRSGHYVGNTGAEGRDSLYVCLFGAWVPVYTFSHVMA